jgi:hypothetical protein
MGACFGKCFGGGGEARTSLLTCRACALAARVSPGAPCYPRLPCVPAAVQSAPRN